MHPADMTPEKCPNCQTPLSPWERVLLSVDHALKCKACGYQIRFDESVTFESHSDPQLGLP